jgi:hypothetical protein
MSNIWTSERTCVRNKQHLRRAVEISNTVFGTDLEVVDKQSFRQYYSSHGYKAETPCDCVVRLRNKDTAYELGMVAKNEKEWTPTFDAHGGGFGLVDAIGEEANRILSCLGAAEAEQIAKRHRQKVDYEIDEGLLVMVATEMAQQEGYY